STTSTERSARGRCKGSPPARIRHGPPAGRRGAAAAVRRRRRGPVWRPDGRSGRGRGRGAEGRTGRRPGREPIRRRAAQGFGVLKGFAVLTWVCSLYAFDLTRGRLRRPVG